MTASIEDRICARVDQRGERECWPWIGGKGKDPQTGRFYGDFRDGSRGPRKRAHRWVWELVFGPIPKGMIVLRTCGESLCCNPWHMALADYSSWVRPGRPQTPETKAKISASVMARVPEILVQPDRRRCSKCAVWKNTARDFYWTRRKLKSGMMRVTPYGWCKECCREKTRAITASLTPLERQGRRSVWEANRKRARTADRLPRVDGDHFRRWLGVIVHESGPSAVAAAVGVDEGRVRFLLRDRGRVGIETIEKFALVFGDTSFTVGYRD